MPKIRESVITGRSSRIEIPVYVLSDNGTNARIRLEDNGTTLKQNQEFDVPSDDIEPGRVKQRRPLSREN